MPCWRRSKAVWGSSPSMAVRRPSGTAVPISPCSAAGLCGTTRTRSSSSRSMTIWEAYRSRLASRISGSRTSCTSRAAHAQELASSLRPTIQITRSPKGVDDIRSLKTSCTSRAEVEERELRQRHWRSAVRRRSSRLVYGRQMAISRCWHRPKDTTLLYVRDWGKGRCTTTRSADFRRLVRNPGISSLVVDSRALGLSCERSQLESNVPIDLEEQTRARTARPRTTQALRGRHSGAGRFSTTRSWSMSSSAQPARSGTSRPGPASTFSSGDGYPHYPLAAGATGHELSGTVVKAGPGVETLKVGDRVAYWGSSRCRPGTAGLAGMPNSSPATSGASSATAMTSRSSARP